MKIELHGINNTYPLICERGILSSCSSYFDKNKKVLIVTDENIPSSYYKDILNNIDQSYVYILPPGEKSKSFDNYLKIQSRLVELSFTRNDVIVSCGGGVVSDLTGFVASTYKRGIKWISIPTSSLSMIDASVGGKTAVDFDSIKNVIGTFYSPSLLLLDMDTLKSLPQRELTNGLFEALKMGFIMDKSILELMEDPFNNLEEIIVKSIIAKDEVVAIDPKEENLRRILNFGHTIGHALESHFSLGETLKHGEAVGYGMRFVIDDSLKEALKHYSSKLNLPQINISKDDIPSLMKYIKNDKKASNKGVSFVFVNSSYQANIKSLNNEEIERLIAKEVESWHQ